MRAMSRDLALRRWARSWIAALFAIVAILVTLGMTISVYTFLGFGTATSDIATAMRRVAVLIYGSVSILKAVTVFLVRHGLDDHV